MRGLKTTGIMLALGMTSNGLAVESTKFSTSASVDIASAYLIRGDTINRGPAIQPGLSISSSSGFTFGFWGNFNVEDQNDASNEGEFGEIDVFVEYELPLKSDVFSASIGAIEYTYPGAYNQELDTQSDREIKLHTAVNTFANPSVTLYYALAGAIEEDLYGEIAISESVYSSKDVTLGVKAIAGYIDPKVGESGWRHGTIAITSQFKDISASINYIIETDKEVLELDDDEDEPIYMTVGTSYTF